MGYTTNEKRVDDAPGERRAIHLLELIINKKESTHEQYMIIIDDVAPLWMKNGDKFYQPLYSWMSNQIWFPTPIM